ncbi:MAG: hypothetical protein AAGI48_15085 [Verrucomicrobiota bacterium]
MACSVVSLCLCASVIAQDLPAGWSYGFGLTGKGVADAFSISISRDREGGRNVGVFLGDPHGSKALSLDWVLEHGEELLEGSEGKEKEIGGRKVWFIRPGSSPEMSSVMIRGEPTWPALSTNDVYRLDDFERVLKWAREHEDALRKLSTDLESGPLKNVKRDGITVIADRWSLVASVNAKLGDSDAWIGFLKWPEDDRIQNKGQVRFADFGWSVDLVEALVDADRQAAAGELTRTKLFSKGQRGAYAMVIGFPESGQVVLRLGLTNEAVPRMTLKLSESELRRLDKILASRELAEEALKSLILALSEDS